MKPWNEIPITDNKDQLIKIPEFFNFVNPHPYLKLGAPYRNKECVWNLRAEVVNRLVKASNYLKSKDNDYSLLIYDSWRPIEVQAYMFEMAFDIECKKIGINVSFNDRNFYPEILKKVEKFWAYPSYQENSPPPHSTGGALDVTLLNKFGLISNLGSNIDEMGESANPDYYKNKNYEEAIIWDRRRNLLRDIMIKFGFVQHPNEWWHFSYGDQLWAWKRNKASALYGKIKI